MRGILGLVLGVGGGWAAWWAFHKAEAGDGSNNLVGLATVIICIIGIILLILHIRKWWMAE